eukprot:gb/GEZN01007294.1/.p1 GENE.gb/GEZN01007294.1/~~gb/GEZN01007294.1/.p1  ORF type:complete len:421 (-),score=57.28 gb/GEZN01007294.1/:227-1489(-)
MPKKAKQVTVGNRKLTVGTQLLEMRESTDLYQQGRQAELLQRLQEDGYLFVKSVLNSETVNRGRKSILTFLEKKGAILAGTDPLEAKIAHAVGLTKAKPQFQEGFCISTRTGGCASDREPEETQNTWKAFSLTEPIRNMYHGPELFSFFDVVFGPKHHKSFADCTWLRMKGRGEVTAEHADYYYFKGNTSIFADNMGKKPQECQPVDEICQRCGKDERPEETLICDICGRGCHMYCSRPVVNKVPEGEWHCQQCADLPFNFYTCWVSWGDARIGEEGGLCVVPNTHRTLGGFDRPLAGKPLLPQDYKALQNSKGLTWRSSNYGPGDIVLFNIKTVHAASQNYSFTYRLSCDTRVFHSDDENALKFSLQAFNSRPGHELERGSAEGRIPQNKQKRADARGHDKVPSTIKRRRVTKLSAGMM